MGDYLIDTERTYTIRLNQPFSYPYVLADGTVTERWQPAYNDSDDTVTILDELSDYDRRAIESAGAQVAYHLPGVQGAQITSTTREAMYLAIFKRVIKAWTLSHTGQMLPLTEETFKRLGPVGQWLYDAIEAHYQHKQLTPAQARNFTRTPAPSFSAPALSTPPSPTSTSDTDFTLTPIESSAGQAA